MSDDDPPGLNSPRRKARFHSQYESEAYRRPSSPRRAPAGTPPASVGPELSGDEEPAADGQDPAAAPVDELSPEATAEPAAPESEGNDLLPNFRLNKVYEERAPRTNPLKDWRWLLVMAALLALGLAGGYALGLANAPAALASAKVMKHSGKTVLDGLTPEVQAQVDAAFDATKHTHYKEAGERFAALHREHPEWWSMSIESARAALYQHDIAEAKHALNDVTSEQGLPDVDFIMGLLHLTNKELDLSETSFATAVARDPARPDFYYFWGECLRRDGKPREAVEKFRAALLRNQYENAEGLYTVKLWLSQIQADQEETSGTNKEIDTALAAARPPYEAFFAAAARELKAKRYQGAADFIRRALAVTEPAVFRVIMQDPTFLEESATHAELAPFYH